MAFGMDYTNVPPSAVQTSMASFVCRYVGYFSGYDMNNIATSQSKCLWPGEAKQLLALGIDIVSNFEWYNTRPTEGFDAGVTDARIAAIIHAACGGPATAPIYFSVDFPSDGTSVVDYFKGVASVLGIDRTGAYGGYDCIKHLLDNNLIKWAWQTYAWSGTNIDPRANIYQYNNGQTLTGGFSVDFDKNLTVKYGGWKEYDMSQPWFMYPNRFQWGDTSFDVGLGGPHDIDILAPANYPVTSIVSGTISDISAPSWGKQVGVALDVPVNGIGWFHYLHLSATNPALSVGQRVNIGDLIGWVGGATSPSQYDGTSNPTGSNFLNSPDQSDSIQVGVALMNGPAYGGPGWQVFPPINPALNPQPIIDAARTLYTQLNPPSTPPPTPNFKAQQFEAVWKTTQLGLKWHGSGLYLARLAAFMTGKLGACTPTQDEQTVSIDGVTITDWTGKDIKWQRYDDGSHGEWTDTGGGKIYDTFGRPV